MKKKRSIRRVVSLRYLVVVTTLTFPAMITTILFLAMFLNETLISKKMMNPKLRVFKWPFVLTIIPIWVINIYSAAVLSRYKVNFQVIKGSVLFSCTVVGISLIYLTTVGVVMIKKLYLFKSQIMRKMIFLISLSFLGVCLLLVGIIAYTVGFYVKTFNVPRYIAGHYFCWSGGSIILLPQVIIYSFTKNNLKTSTASTKINVVSLNKKSKDTKSIIN